VSGADGSRAIVLVVDGDVEVASWPLERPPRLDLSVVDSLARLQLAARRLGLSIRLRNPCAELCALIALAGLADALPLEARGQTEGREQLGVEEVVDGGDPPL
jgi:hypothetical protein